VIGTVYLVKLARRTSKITNLIEGELVVPWSAIKTLVVTNMRSENVADKLTLILSIASTVYKQIGD
jgi:hypothetical protein